MSALTDLLLAGPRSGPDIRGSLGISQATFSRLVNNESQIVSFGKARATRYALLRPVRGTAAFPLWQIDERGTVWPFGTLLPCWPQGSCLVALKNGLWQWFDGLPWYLTDLRPQGFLGRAWCKKLAARAALPDDIRLWQEEEVLLALSMTDGEHPGGWLIGDKAYQRWLHAERNQPIPQQDKPARYALLAQEALAGEIVGSSAGGEQPKFSCYAMTDSGPAQVLVKFTAPQRNAVSQRWADLLCAEAIALDVLRKDGIAASEARWFTHPDGQAFLEVRRFDCEGEEGRRSIVSLESLQSEFVAGAGHWPVVVKQLAAQKRLEAQTVECVDVCWAFGRLIGNTDMHAGNLSFYLSDFPVQVTPVYDMLPMAWAPNSAGGMRERAIDVIPETVVARQHWLRALMLAERFWQRVEGEPRISEAFRIIAREMQGKLHQAAGLIARMA